MMNNEMAQIAVLENTTRDYETDTPLSVATVSDLSDIGEPLSQATSIIGKFKEDFGAAFLSALIKSRLARFSRDSVTTINYSGGDLAGVPMLKDLPKKYDIDELLEYDIITSVSPPIKEETVRLEITEVEKCPSIRKP